MKKTVTVTGLLVLLFCSLPVVAYEGADQATAFQLAQVGKTCQNFNEACGLATGAGGGPTACCEPYVCHNGICKKYRGGSEPCGSMADPPCERGLACIGGFCKR